MRDTGLKLAFGWATSALDTLANLLESDFQLPNKASQIRHLCQGVHEVQRRIVR